MTYQIGSLLSVLADQPRLPGALCTEVPRLFDWTLDDDEHEPKSVRAQRHLSAAEICTLCPALTPCRIWASTLEPGHVPGVVAGTIRGPKGHPETTTRRHAS